MIEVTASARVAGDIAPLVERVRWTLERLGVVRAQVGLMIVGGGEMAALNARHRGVEAATDVLSFPIDGAAADWPPDGPPPELGDIVICPEAAEGPLDVLVIHGALHLLGYDHEADDGEMLRLQDELVAAAT